MGMNDLKFTENADHSPAFKRLGETVITPTADNTRAYRNALGRFATGVTVVTTHGSEGPVGMTVNSFASVSLEPPLVLWSLSKSSGRFTPFREAEHYAIHVLDEHQGFMATEFARNAEALNHCDWFKGNGQTPLINNTLARFECRTIAQHDAGDHVIIVGEVERVTAREGSPLVFAGGQFGGFAAS